MLELTSLQKHFQTALLQNDPTISHHIISSEAMSADKRLQVYRQAYFLRLLNVLTESFPILKKLLGPETFIALCEKYIGKYPSYAYSLNAFGKDFANFLATESYSKSQTFLTEMAHFEWALENIFSIRNQPQVTFDQMNMLHPQHWPTMRFRLQEGYASLIFYWNIVAYWQAAKESKSIELIKLALPSSCLVWRKHYDVQFCLLNTIEKFFLEAIEQQRNFAEICEALTAFFPKETIALEAAGLLKRFIAKGLITEIYFSHE